MGRITACYLWVSDGWMADGAYLVTRKVRMMIETWDRTSLGEQQTIIGRDKGEGAPLSGGHEFDEPDFSVVKNDASVSIASRRVGR